jgi:hypothetical protein
LNALVSLLNVGWPDVPQPFSEMNDPETPLDCKPGQPAIEGASAHSGYGAESGPAISLFRPLLDGYDAKMLEEEPFPLLVVENALPSELYQSLRQSLPGYLDTPCTFNCSRPTQGLDHYPEGYPASLNDDLPDNTKMGRRAFEMLADPALPEVWRVFVSVNTGQEALRSMLNVFGDVLLREYPDFESRFGSLSELQAVQRFTKQLTPNEVELDATFLLHTPVHGPVSQQRGPHLKGLNKPIEGFLYLEPLGFEGPEAVHEFYAIKEGVEPVFGAGLQLETEALELVRSVPARGNTLVVFLNTPRSIQTIAPRRSTPFPLLAVEVLMQVQAPLIKVARQLSVGAPAVVSSASEPGSPLGRTSGELGVGGAFAGEGWYVPERDSVGWFQWTGPASVSYVDLPWQGSGEGLLRCHVRHAISDNALETLNIQVQDHTLGLKRRQHEGGVLIEAAIPMEVLERFPGRVRVHFHVPGTARPSQIPGAGGVDSRLLGIGVGSLSIVPFVSKRKAAPIKEASKEAPTKGDSSGLAAKVGDGAATRTRPEKGLRRLRRFFKSLRGR